MLGAGWVHVVCKFWKCGSVLAMHSYWPFMRCTIFCIIFDNFTTVLKYIAMRRGWLHQDNYMLFVQGSWHKLKACTTRAEPVQVQPINTSFMVRIGFIPLVSYRHCARPRAWSWHISCMMLPPIDDLCEIFLCAWCINMLWWGAHVPSKFIAQHLYSAWFTLTPLAPTLHTSW